MLCSVCYSAMNVAIIVNLTWQQCFSQLFYFLFFAGKTICTSLQCNQVRKKKMEWIYISYLICLFMILSITGSYHPHISGFSNFWEGFWYFHSLFDTFLLLWRWPPPKWHKFLWIFAKKIGWFCSFFNFLGEYLRLKICGSFFMILLFGSRFGWSNSIEIQSVSTMNFGLKPR